MASGKPVLFLISYDIADPKRLSRIHRVLKKQGLPLQYSVFTVSLTQRQLQQLLQRFKRIIDHKEDDIRCYALPAKIECRMIGEQVFPDDVLLFSAGLNHLFL